MKHIWVNSSHILPESDYFCTLCGAFASKDLVINDVEEKGYWICSECQYLTSSNLDLCSKCGTKFGGDDEAV